MIRIVKTKEPQIHEGSSQVLLRLAAFVLALCAGGLFLLVLGNNPIAIVRHHPVRCVPLGDGHSGNHQNYDSAVDRLARRHARLQDEVLEHRR